MEQSLKRRNFLRWTALGMGAALMPWRASAAAVCTASPPQTAGPFYPGESSFSAINDLTRVAGASAQAVGQVILIRGQVRDGDCQSLSGVNIEIWQACASGRYNNDGDTNPATLDMGFRYWGETTTASDGSYEFKTIKPGAYPAAADWDRPPHIHFRVSRLGFHELITQMYFKGETLNLADKILQQVPSQMRASVIVDFKAQRDGTLAGVFDLTVLKV